MSIFLFQRQFARLCADDKSATYHTFAAWLQEGCSPITEDVWKKVMDEDDLFNYANHGVGRETQVVDRVFEVCTENENSGDQVNNDEDDGNEHDNNEYEST